MASAAGAPARQHLIPGEARQARRRATREGVEPSPARWFHSSQCYLLEQCLPGLDAGAPWRRRGRPCRWRRRYYAERTPTISGGDCAVNESGILPIAFSSELFELLIAHCGEVDAVRSILG